MMRIKSSKGMEKRILGSKRYVRDSYDHCGRWNEYFGNENDLYVELGTGRGDFLFEAAQKYPHKNFIGVEKYLIVLARAAGKMEGTGVENVAFITDDITNIDMITARDSVTRIYMNFLDPWPKKKHEKRRSTNMRFLDKYRHILKTGGEIHFKTDNAGFFEYTLRNMEDAGFTIRYVTTDLYNSDQLELNIQSEYEKKFVSNGIDIYKIVASKI